MKALRELIQWIRPAGRIVVVLRGEEIVICRVTRPGTLKLFVGRAEPDAEWVLSRTRISTHSG